LTQIGPYTVEREIGRGGMGVVYLARDSGLGRSVAIKAVPAEWQHDAERMGRFEREARLLASMNHPSIASVYGLQEHEGRKYLVMEFVEGRSLADIVRDDSAVPVDEALALGAQVAGAMEAAHDAGIVHRDLKPGNVIVTPEGRVKVLDFGLAKGSPAAGSSIMGDPMSPTLTTPRAREVLSATGLGRVLGTVGYMSPEQARGKAVDRRTDVWALGCVLFEMLSGSRAFDGETQTDAIAALLEREPDWKALPGNTPPRVRELLAKCLEKDVNRRLRDAGDARLELEKALANREWTSSFITSASALGLPAARGGRGRWIGAALLGLLGTAAGIGIGAALWSGSTVVAPVAREPVCLEVTLDIPETAPERGWPIRGLRLAPDGSAALFQLGGPDPRLVVREFGSFETRLLDGTRGSWSATWSPDGRWVAFVDPIRIAKVPRGGGPPVTISETNRYYGEIEWLRDGRIAVRERNSGSLFTVPESGGELTVLLKPDPAKGVLGFDSVVEAGPDSALLVGSYNANTIDAYEIYAVDRDGKNPRRSLSQATAAVVAGPETLVFLRDSSLYAVPMDFVTGEPRGEERLVLQGVFTYDWGSGGVFDAAPNGTLAYLPGQREIMGRTLVWLGPDGAVGGILDDPEALSELIAVSADGRWIAYTTIRRRMELWLLDTERGTRQLLDDRAEYYAGAFSSDGRRLASTRLNQGGGDSTSAIVIFEGAGVSPLVLDRPELDGMWVTGWDPSGVAVLAARAYTLLTPRASSDLVRVPLEPSGEVTELVATREQEWDGSVSPDGKWLVYCATEGEGLHIYLSPYPPDGRRWRVSREGGEEPRWAGPNQIVWHWFRALHGVDLGFEGGEVRIGTPRKLFDSPFQRSVRAHDHIPYGTEGRVATIRPGPQELDQPPLRVIMNWDGGPVE